MCCTHTRVQVQSNIKGVLGMLRANHPEDCMTCEANGVCEFQDLIKKYNVRAPCVQCVRVCVCVCVCVTV